MLREQRGATRYQITKELCRLWNWRLPSGALSLGACRDFLCRLQEHGLIKLPAPRTRPGRCKKVTISESEETRNAQLSEPVVKDDVDFRRVVVRPVRRAEVSRWRALMARFHYLGDGGLVGESLRYVAESECGWLALLSWSSASWKSRHREAFVGWDERSKQQRLRFVVNNGRFLILPWVRVPHLASCILAANVRRLSGDWVDRYGHPILLVETFVDLGSDFAVRATEQPTGSILAVPEEWDARVRDTRRMANRRGCLFSPFIGGRRRFYVRRFLRRRFWRQRTWRNSRYRST